MRRTTARETAARLYSPTGRDEAFWLRPNVTIAGLTPRAYQIEMHARLREARNWAEVHRLRDDNAALIAQLDRATREDVLAALAAREQELRGDG